MEECLFNSLIEQHHYLGYEQPVGEHLKYLVWTRARPIAYMAWSSAPRHLGSRDRHIGWSAETRRRNIRLVAYNTRFLILPWHAGENIADVLKQRAQKLPSPIQMCDALSRNTPKVSGVEIVLANCMAHGRRQFVEIAPNFPAE